MAKRVRVGRRLSAALVIAGLTLAWAMHAGPQETASPETPDTLSPDGSAEVGVLLLTVQDAIGPATSDYIRRGIERAEQRGATLVVLQLDTPGGLDTAMREIIQSILRSEVPVASYVWPQGARAASAGTYILYASHVAAMAPATNLGAATPVAIGGTPAEPRPAGGGDEPAATRGEPDASAERGADRDAESSPPRDGEPPAAGRAPDPGTASERKAINDAVAYIRSLAERRGRNAEWAERAVRSAESLSASAALDMDVIDIVATSLEDLLAQLDGRSVMLPSGETTLETTNLTVERFEPDWRTRFLAVISNPTVAYLLMLIGIYGLIFEGYNPGGVLPGVVGAISLLLALFAFQVLPVNYAGLALIALGVILIVAEFMVPSFGALGIGGIAAFIFGSIILIDSDVPGFGVSLPLITTIAATGAVSLLGIVWLAMQSRRRPVVSGSEQMASGYASALEDFEREGAVWIHGERWRALTTAPVRKGQRVKVTHIDGLLLYVEPVETQSG